MNQQDRFRVTLIEALHAFYKRLLSPLVHAGAGVSGGACRFQPTCSEYAAIAFHEYGWLRGSWMALKRLLRCHPGCKGGFDPVPPKHHSCRVRARQLP
ncbi:membrane protein insertion efficiency factor YidD [Alloacidobacterium sp.]|uniref:membrane protein insertion efficiency factor YidD n=1 Tax=Alloacidobacterium sp. TaxID=2951999 RepID=UPI002D362875|nr:membrane protein insertion efficiency factor YidD [Alloacidobacterium sp.]HYK37943.1 membrane protein insertion efficiency factor YidD [Alloacidobacterium sp.]